MEDEAFLAAQGVLSRDMEKIKREAKENKYSVFHQFCENEFEKNMTLKIQTKIVTMMTC